jgi:alpha-glucosidase
MIDFAAQARLQGRAGRRLEQGLGRRLVRDRRRVQLHRAYPDFRPAGLAAYARRKGVALIGHHETSANVAHYETRLDAGLDLYQRLGIPAVKTGYVADAGGVQAIGPDGRKVFEWHEGQLMSRHHLKVVTEAAERRIAVNPHEPIKDTGLRRTYPIG